MMPADAQSAAVDKLLSSVSAAATANATGTGVLVNAYEGQLVLVVNVGAVTGSITPSLEECTDAGGTGAAALTPIESAWGTVSANTCEKRSYAKPTKPYVRFKGVIVTGPALVSATLIARKKNV